MKSRFLVLACFSATCVLTAQSQQVVFNFTGSAQTWIVPTGVTSIAVDARGGQGGGNAGDPLVLGGKGGRLQTTVAVTPGETLTIYVGGRGGDLINPNTGGPGGFNGGGTGGVDDVDGNGPAGGGGGASDVRQGSDDLAHRVLVAGGGGGAECCEDANGGAGGGLIGMDGGSTVSSSPGGGGTQTSGGAGGNVGGAAGGLGQGGVGGDGNRAGGGGGGGYYGGGGGGGSTYGSGGGGGSSYSVGTGTIHTQGYQSGNGQVIITLQVSSPESLIFPLKGTITSQDAKLNPWTAPLITAFDHSMADATGNYHIYGFDGIVEAFTSEVGACSYTPPPPQCPAKRDGYHNSNTTPFGVNGHYTGDSSDGGILKLQYEGHPGFDYKASCTRNTQKACELGTGTNVYAATGGKIHYPSTVVGLCSGSGCATQYHAMELMPDSAAYLIFYLHLSTYPGAETITATDPSPAPGCPATVVLPLTEGTPVLPGCLVAQSGNTAPPPGVGPHLHFEVQAVLPRVGLPTSVNCQVLGAKMACVPVDPYGWSCGTDPYLSLLPVSNIPLWNSATGYVSPAALCFGNQPVGVSGQLSLVLTNVAGSILSLKPASISGLNATDFGQSNNCPRTLAAAGSCQFTVTFTPAASGPRNAFLTITGKDGSGQVLLVVSLSGTGT
jgi:hypothetical protein